jgi:hypothetical protein
MRKRIFVLLRAPIAFCFVIAASGVSANDEERLELARELVIASGGFEQYEGILDSQIDASASVLMDQVRSQRPDLSEAQLSDIRQTFDTYIDDSLVVDEAAIVAVYADIFTASELRSMADFYQTEAGQALLSKGPELSQRLAELTFANTQSALPKMLEALAKYRRADPPE